MDQSSPPPLPSTRQIKYMPTSLAYDLWAPTYDSDKNFLQALDTLELETLLPEFFERVVAHDDDDDDRSGVERAAAAVKVIDLGCGTGRNLLRLVELAERYGIREIVGLDFSRAMLDVARRRVDDESRRQRYHGSLSSGSCSSSSSEVPEIHLCEYDLTSPTALTSIPEPCLPPDSNTTTNLTTTTTTTTTAIISTLVLEHVPLRQYFRICSALLPQPGSYLLLTNMHADQAAQGSGAGFTDSGEKIRVADSFAYTVDEVVEVAGEFGFVVVGGKKGIRERGVESEEVVERLGERSRKWFELGVKTWFGMVLVRV